MAIKVDCPACKMGWCGENGRPPCDDHEVVAMCDAHPMDEAVELNRDGVGMCQECSDDADVFHNPHNAAHQHLWVEAQAVVRPQWCKTCTGKLGEGRRPCFGVICAGCNYRECELCQGERRGIGDVWGEEAHHAA